MKLGEFKTFYEKCGRALTLSRWQSLVFGLLMWAGTAYGANATAIFTFVGQWPGGAQGSIKISNHGATPINGWTLAFDWTGEITDRWNAVQQSHTGTHYVLTNESWNGVIAPGAFVEIGFIADMPIAGDRPANLMLNGEPVGDGTAPVITTSSLPNATQGIFYSQTLASVGGAAPVAWSVGAGALPAGLTLSQGGVLSGVPTAPGPSNFTLQVADSAVPAHTGARSFSVTVSLLPQLNVTDANVTLTPSSSTGNPWLSTNGNQIVDASGNPVRITGINWFGFGTNTNIVHGLWTRNYKNCLDQIKQLGFNCLRISYADAMLRPDAVVTSASYTLNPDLQGLTPIQCLDKVIEYCGQIGLRVFLDRHSALPDNYNNEQLWYLPNDPYYTEQRWIDNWVLLAQRYAGDATVIGADLYNEPKGVCTWGTDLATAWNKAAERCGNAILAVNPNWLIIVEGVAVHNDNYYWWGGNLMGYAAHPITLNVANKLVLSIHDYPASVFPMTWFGDPSYPANLPGVWTSYWGYTFINNTAPMIIGEFGSKLLTASDQTWMDKLTDYMDGDFNLDGTRDLPASKKGMSWTYWCFNPNSTDTGGILNADWTTIDTKKMNMIQGSLAPMLGSGAAAAGGQTAAVTISLSTAPTSSPVTLNWSTVADTALAGTHFTPASGTLTFVAGETSKTIAIALLPQSAPQGIKTFTIQLSGITNASVLASTATIHLLGALTPFEAWQVASFTGASLGNPIISGLAADPDHDGVPNVLEHLAGLNPLASDPPFMSMVRTASMIEVTLNRRAAATDVNVLLEWSDDLVNWSSTGTTGPILLNDNGTSQVVKFTVPVGSGIPQRFVRLKAQSTL